MDTLENVPSASASSLRSNQDCYFYYYSSCTKGDSCPYRHEPAALCNETMCIYWLQGNCTKPHCMFRHLEIMKQRDKIQCFYEKQPGGCKKLHCPFKHENVLNQPHEDDVKKKNLILPLATSSDPQISLNVDSLAQVKAARNNAVKASQERTVIIPEDEDDIEVNPSLHKRMKYSSPDKCSLYGSVKNRRIEQGDPSFEGGISLEDGDVETIITEEYLEDDSQDAVHRRLRLHSAEDLREILHRNNGVSKKRPYLHRILHSNSRGGDIPARRPALSKRLADRMTRNDDSYKRSSRHHSGVRNGESSDNYSYKDLRESITLKRNKALETSTSSKPLLSSLIKNENPGGNSATCTDLAEIKIKSLAEIRTERKKLVRKSHTQETLQLKQPDCSAAASQSGALVGTEDPHRAPETVVKDDSMSSTDGIHELKKTVVTMPSDNHSAVTDVPRDDSDEVTTEESQEEAETVADADSRSSLKDEYPVSPVDASLLEEEEQLLLQQRDSVDLNEDEEVNEDELLN